MSTTSQSDDEVDESQLLKQQPEAAIESDAIRSHEAELSEQSDIRVPVTIRPEEREVLRDKMKDMFASFITDIDNHVLDVGKSQCELDSQLDTLIATLDSIRIDEKLTKDISDNAKRISSLKSRLTVIHTILSDSSTRCSRTLAACGSALKDRSPTDSSVSSTTNSNQQQQSDPMLARTDQTSVEN